MTSGQEQQLPKGWCWAAIDQLAEVQGGLTKGKKRSVSDRLREVPYLRVANVQRGFLDLQEIKTIPATEEEINALRLKKGDILFNEGGDRDKLGRGWVWNDELAQCIHQNHVFRARLVTDEVLPRYVSWYANSNGQSYFFRVGKQTTNLASMNLTMLRHLPVPVPPLAEQRRIVEAIESYVTRLDAAVATLERVKANLRRYRASVLKTAIEGRLVPTEAALARQEGRDYEPGAILLERILKERRRRWEEAELAKLTARGKTTKDDRWKKKYEEPNVPDTSNLPGLPEGWCWATLESLFRTITDGDHMPPPQVDSGVPFLVIGNLRSGKADFSETRHVPIEYYEALDATRRPQYGDVLYTVTGSFGIPILVDFYKPFCVQRHIAVLKPTKYTRATFFARILASRFTFAQAAGVSTGTAQKTVPLKGLRRIVVHVPPLIEQERILAEINRHMSVLESVFEDVAVNLRRCQRLRQAILKRAFEGKLVEQDATDEPASVLLERIRAERQKTRAECNKSPGRSRKKETA